MTATGRVLTNLLIALMAVASLIVYAIPPRLLAAEERANQQVEQAPASWIGQRVVTKYAAPLKSDGKVVDDGAVLRIYTATRVDRDLVNIESGNVSRWVRASELVLLSQAIEFYTAEIKSRPGNHEAFHRRGLIWESKSEYDKAVADYTEAIGLSGQAAVPFLARGRAFLEFKKAFGWAIADYSAAIKLEPSAPSHTSAELCVERNSAVRQCNRRLQRSDPARPRVPMHTTSEVAPGLRKWSRTIPLSLATQPRSFRSHPPRLIRVRVRSSSSMTLTKLSSISARRYRRLTAGMEGNWTSTASTWCRR